MLPRERCLSGLYLRTHLTPEKKIQAVVVEKSSTEVANPTPVIDGSDRTEMPATKSLRCLFDAD
jgi:hypothetical protein